MEEGAGGVPDLCGAVLSATGAVIACDSAMRDQRRSHSPSRHMSDYILVRTHNPSSHTCHSGNPCSLRLWPPAIPETNRFN